MVDVTMEELRLLSRSSRRTHAYGVGAVAAGLLALPAFLVLATLLPQFTTWSAVFVVLAAGAFFLRYAHVAGQSRGTFRKVFRDLKVREKARAASSSLPARVEKDAAAQAA